MSIEYIKDELETLENRIEDALRSKDKEALKKYEDQKRVKRVEFIASLVEGNLERNNNG